MEANNKTGNYALINGLNMYYEIHGSGQPLVLIHGGGSTIKTNFSTLIPLLAERHRLIAIELQAHGHTPDRDTPESFVQDADDVAALLDHLNIAQADVLGFSNGGQTCIEIGLRYPEKVRKFIIASAFYTRDAIFEGFWDGFKVPDFNHLPQAYKDEYLKIPGNTADGLMAMFKRDAERMLHFKGWTDEQLQSIKKPVMVVAGDQDLPSHQHLATMADLFPNSRLAILPGNHGSYMGEAMSWGQKSKIPELFAEMVSEFLAG